MPLIGFDAIDSAGKTTLVNGVVQGLRDNGYDKINVLHFPDKDAPVGELIYKILRDPLLLTDPFSLALLYEVDRRRKLADMTVGKTSKDWWIILDRFYGSGLAYAKANGITDAEYHILEQICNRYQKPDKAFILDTPVESALVRMSNRNKDTFESNSVLQHSVRQNLLDLAKRNGWYVLDGNKSPDILIQAVLRVIL